MEQEDIKYQILEWENLLTHARNSQVIEIINNQISLLQCSVPQTSGKSDTSLPIKIDEDIKSFTSDSYTLIETFSWDQNDIFVRIYFTMPSVHLVPKKNFHKEFTKSSFEFRVEGVEGINYRINSRCLCHEIDPSGSYEKVKRDSVTIYLKKVGNRNWNSIHKTETKEKKITPPKSESDPCNSIMGMMKQMYEDGDDEMKRTIAKAWTESCNQRSLGAMGNLPDFNAGNIPGMPDVQKIGKF